VGSNEVFDANKQIEFINNILKTDVHIVFTFSTILFKNAMGLTLIAVLFQFVKSLYTFLLNQWTWFAISLIVYIVCCGGVVYGLINQTPFFRFGRNEFGAVVVQEYVMRGQRGQYMGEGYMASTLMCLIGLGYLYLSKVTELNDSKHKVRIAVVVCLFTLYVLHYCLTSMYIIKSPWYNPGFLPPDYYQRGSLWNDQGNTI
jgi:hypothetical protein